MAAPLVFSLLGFFLVASALLVPNTALAAEGPIASYSFDEGKGETAHDSAGSHDATVHGAEWVSGKFGSALNFDGENDHVSIPNSADLGLTGDFTLEAWVRPHRAQVGAPVLTKETESFYSYALYAGGEESAKAEGNVADKPWSYSQATDPETLPSLSWSHLALTYDGKDLRLYVDGELVKTVASASAQESEGNLEIGGNEVFNEHYEGLIDELRLYNRALDAEEIEEDKETAIEAPQCHDLESTIPTGDPRQLSLKCIGAGKLTYEVASEPKHGSISAFNAETGTLTYTSAKEFTGIDSFTFRAFNATGESNTATATVNVCRPPEATVGEEVTEPETPGVGLSVVVSPAEAEPPCQIGEVSASIKKLSVYIDEELVYSEDSCEDPEEPCGGGAGIFRIIQLPYAKVIGTHTYHVEAEDQFGDQAKPVEWTETTPEAGTISQVPPEAEDSKESKGCETPKNRASKYVIRQGTLYGTNCADIIPVHPGVTTYRGEGGDDRIRGGGRSETISGGPGNDTIFAGRGSDMVFGEGGNDRLDGGTGDDHIQGGEGDDTLIGGPGADKIHGKGGDDLVRGGTTTDELFGGSGTNTLSYADGVTPGFEADPETGSSNAETDLVEGFPAKHGGRGVYVNLSGSPATIGNDGAAARYGGGTDVIEPKEFQNVIGTPFADLIVGSSEDNVIDAGPGTDIVRGGDGHDQIYGGADSDYLDGGGEQEAATVHGGIGTDTCLNGGDESSCESSNPENGVEPPSAEKISVGLFEPDDSEFHRADLYVRGSELPDSVTATWSAENVHFAAKGEGAGRFDTADNEVSGCEVTATTADCPITGADSIVMSGGPGRDVLKAQKFPTAMSVTLLGGTEGDTLIGGNESEDILIDGPGEGTDKLHGNGGDDALFENSGTDTLDGGEGNDLFISSTVCDGDTIRGGGGSDNANWAQLVGLEIEPENPAYPAWGQRVYEDPEHGVHATLANGGGEGTLDRQGKACSKEGKIFGVEGLEGSRAADVLVGNEDANTLLGRSGADVLRGLGGKDHLLANNRHGSHKDPDEELNCGAGEDTIKIDPKEDVGHIFNCERIYRAKGANARVSGIESGPTAEELPSLDESMFGVGGNPDAATPIALFRLDENSGGTAANWMDQGESDGTYKNGVDLGEPGAIAESQGVHFDGVNDYLDLTNKWDPSESFLSSCNANLNAYGVEMWVKFDSAASGREALFSRSEGGERGLFIYRSADGRLNFTVGRPEGFVPTTRTDEPVSDGEWHHVVVTLEQYLYCEGQSGPFHEPRMTLYVDGASYPLESFEYPFPMATPSAHNLVGARQGSSGLTDWLKAEVDDVAIYDEALSEEEVEAHLAISEAQPSSTVLLPRAEKDSDEDGVPDGRDNCPETSNPEQEDSDLDGVGDACQVEPDSDEDGVPDATDNCPEVSNSEQTDTNENSIGDACEEEE